MLWCLRVNYQFKLFSLILYFTRSHLVPVSGLGVAVPLGNFTDPLLPTFIVFSCLFIFSLLCETIKNKLNILFDTFITLPQKSNESLDQKFLIPRSNRTFSINKLPLREIKLVNTKLVQLNCVCRSSNL